MISMNEKIADELSKATAIWKDLVNNRKSDIEKVSDVFIRYKTFLDENMNLIGIDSRAHNEVDAVALMINRYHEVTAVREKRNLLNDAYLGLMFDLSDSIDVLKNKIAEQV